MICALKEDDRLDCAAHLLKTILRNTFEDSSCPDAVTKLLTVVKSLIWYVKKSSLHTLLKKSLQRHAGTATT